MRLSTHYYVLSLSAGTNMLFEAFRDSLTAVENQGFPVVSSSRMHEPAGADQLLALVKDVDECFAHYATRDPLGVVLVGDEKIVSAFLSVTKHGDAFVGRVEGDHEETSVRDLGQIVWPVLREAMSGVLERAMRDLETLTGRGQVASGLDAVARVAGHARGATLLVEDDFSMRGSVNGSRESPVILSDLDVNSAFDDVVDSVIEMTLQSGGDVVFSPGGSLNDCNRIVMLMNGGEQGPKGPMPS